MEKAVAFPHCNWRSNFTRHCRPMVCVGRNALSWFYRLLLSLESILNATSILLGRAISTASQSNNPWGWFGFSPRGSLALVREIFHRFKAAEKKAVKRPMDALSAFLVVVDSFVFYFFQKLNSPLYITRNDSFALLLVHYWEALFFSKKQLALALALPLTVCGVYFSGQVDTIFENSSDKFLIEKLSLENHSLP